MEEAYFLQQQVELRISFAAIDLVHGWDYESSEATGAIVFGSAFTVGFSLLLSNGAVVLTPTLFSCALGNVQTPKDWKLYFLSSTN